RAVLGMILGRLRHQCEGGPNRGRRPWLFWLGCSPITMGQTPDSVILRVFAPPRIAGTVSF
ncbi:MAG: hypothetical protein EBU97_04910, partial [Rhodobacteraceae bacterium]|nr:hypothetical protein [Paracoccaceae bacterium]